MKDLGTKILWLFFKICFFRIWERCHYDTTTNAFVLDGHRISAEMIKHLESLAKREAVIEMRMEMGGPGRKPTSVFSEITVDGVLDKP